ncbi:hypothetical protein N7494_004193 [Penicillium frequentans]|uniref:Uncharacterized protein n=1 Tax=Penicillium frequentans TaxID=3151616 RepID=A0AAD6D2L2_9EURO|nr:hypothetical protein N7494_004193 [Penicillium glabrum]
MENNTKSPVRSYALTRYLIEGLAGRLQFPVYETNSKDEVIIVPGEMFCRVPGCSNSTNAMVTSDTLQKHLAEWHNLVSEASIIARSTKEEKSARMKWFEQIPLVEPVEEKQEGAKDGMRKALI